MELLNRPSKLNRGFANDTLLENLSTFIASELPLSTEKDEELNAQCQWQFEKNAVWNCMKRS
jgi:hypothetical protein